MIDSIPPKVMSFEMQHNPTISVRLFKIVLVLYNIIFYNINKHNCSSPLPPTRHHAKYGLVDTICNTNFVLFYRGVSVFLSKICSSHTQLAIDGLHVVSLDELYHTSIQKQLLKMINQCLDKCEQVHHHFGCLMLFSS